MATTTWKKLFFISVAMALSTLIIWSNLPESPHVPSPEDKMAATLPLKSISSDFASHPEVTYSIVGDGSISVMFVNETGGTDSVKVFGNWQKTVRLSSERFAYISAQLESENPEGEVIVFIERSEFPAKSSTSHGSYAIASTSARYSK